MNEITCITATLVPDANRLEFLPAMFGTRLMMRGEALVYGWMRRLCKDYQGGYFNFYTPSNGGGYLALAQVQPVQIDVDSNGFSGEMSADAAGIVATLFALCQLSNETEQEGIVELYHALRDFAGEHKEAALIFGAID